ncbi:pantoate--beta-alanine ligase [Xylona heveae TC161]|uniref:Pantoate--beta-alanine ligase n=1 Tax=Xylona heveae (strain CBS 132557 / TC161) TaxID=1328760 RepID=A0A165JFL0_XYLHT|nr:pantoate--beta-alanine ligase [Xylona heveae TC161]KZF26171.1 pantoate--beta-alanine ligase [Xylona heveae TC161]
MQSCLRVFRDVAALRQCRRQLLLSQRTVGLVPTMGALHAGHLSLIRQAARENDEVFVSIFVNPTQFGPNEDLGSYPRTWDADMAKLAELDAELEALASKKQSGANNVIANTLAKATNSSSATAAGESDAGVGGRITAIFAPTAAAMYPSVRSPTEPSTGNSFITIDPLSRLLEGASRPAFFRGVTTVCMKLFNIVEAERVYFGQKDVQQTVIIRRMVQDFFVNTQVRIGATEREADGLAMSSRNVYLGDRRRKVSTVLYKSLRSAEDTYLNYNLGEKRLSRADVLGPAQDLLRAVTSEQELLPPSQRSRIELDYLSLADPDTLEELDEVDPSRGGILSGAVRMLPIEEAVEGEDGGLGDGKVTVRLIDNIILQPRV